MNHPRSFLFAALLGASLVGVSSSAADIEAYRKYALTHDGDATRGLKLFNDEQRVACSKCHSVDGHAGKAGPDLYAAGDAFGRRDLVEAVLQPSLKIAPGYGTVNVETKAGALFQGTLKQKTEAGLQIMGADGKLVSIATAEIKEQSGSPVSLMPEGIHAGLSLQEFTDVIDYLTTLRQPESTVTSSRGAPRDIPQLAKTAMFRPFFAREFKLPPSRFLTGLTSFRQVPGSREVFLVLHQKGMIWRVEKSEAGEDRTVFADLTGEVFSERGPNGLLDVAFHPRFRQNRKYYLFYQLFENGSVATHIDEKEFDADFKADSGKPPRRIMTIVSVAEDHSGGCLSFGPDGFLYLTMGDTGPHNDPNGHAQNLGILLGKVMRIDVDHEEAGKAYAIPKDNPFCGQAGVAPEIWAYGFRNPWRFSFDRITGELWLADVGQDRVEEVDLVRRGENYGWNVYEGFEPFSNQFRKEGRHFTMALFAYHRKYGNSITGGCVVRGDKHSSFFGVYLCGDYTSKRVFGVAQESGALTQVRQIGVLPQSLTSFSEDEAGNVYAVGYEGMIYQIDFNEAVFE